MDVTVSIDDVGNVRVGIILSFVGVGAFLTVWGIWANGGVFSDFDTSVVLTSLVPWMIVGSKNINVRMSIINKIIKILLGDLRSESV